MVGKHPSERCDLLAVHDENDVRPLEHALVHLDQASSLGAGRQHLERGSLPKMRSAVALRWRL